MNIISSLLRVDFTALITKPPQSDEYRQLSADIAAAEKALLDGLDTKQRAQYEECVSLLLSREGTRAEEIFEGEFVLGARTMHEVISGNKILPFH